jgi:hypothetical protein
MIRLWLSNIVTKHECMITLLLEMLLMHVAGAVKL